ncbi:MAG: microcyclamide/patellamide family RiPP [Nostoc sp.]
MDKKNLMSQAAQPVNRTITGQLPAELAELSKEALSIGCVEGDVGSTDVLPTDSRESW